ncbi:hypothetical protein FNB79_13630 [Formosa sediminum]|uniref:Uncharacterized protein n=1 Tax=Formosa sediminum TaxID=2594004 RepID=A0A516GTZ6_9FLAO|nr:hypothetical protein [Formosa sediminum]QDO94965.1 hypothetical protein FNB79_13630 [Formosa sediminum]
MGNLCKYEQHLRQKLEFGTIEYDVNRAKMHEKRRIEYVTFVNEYRILKTEIFKQLSKFQRKEVSNLKRLRFSIL